MRFLASHARSTMIRHAIFGSDTVRFAAMLGEGKILSF
jgi:hypothetical protein